MGSFEQVCDFTLRAMTATKSQGSETCVTREAKNFIKRLNVVKESNTGGKKDGSKSNMSRYFVTAFCFFSTVIKFYSPVKICNYLNRVQCLQLSHKIT